MAVSFEIAGIDSILVRFSDQTSVDLLFRIALVQQQIKSKLTSVVVDLIPSYTSLLVVYDLQKIQYDQMQRLLTKIIDHLPVHEKTELLDEIIEIPVCYDPEVAPDIELLSAQTNLSCDDIIQLHQAIEYRVFAVGFSPGFGYLGHLDKRLQMARLATPRTRVPAGSVAIAEAYTAVYPQESPGGWWLIGRTTLNLFDKTRQPPGLLSVGKKVKFKAISLQDYHLRMLT